MTKIKPITPREALGQQIRYDLTLQAGNPKKRISLSKDFLDLVRQELAKSNDRAINVSDRALIYFALLNLFDPGMQNIVRHYLESDHEMRSLTDLLAHNDHSNEKINSRLSTQLNDLQDSNNRQDIMLESLINAISFLLYDRNHMAPVESADSADDVYAQLREDGLKSIIDAVLRAGANETDRQRHLDNL